MLLRKVPGNASGSAVHRSQLSRDVDGFPGQLRSETGPLRCVFLAESSATDTLGGEPRPFETRIWRQVSWSFLAIEAVMPRIPHSAPVTDSVTGLLLPAASIAAEKKKTARPMDTRSRWRCTTTFSAWRICGSAIRPNRNTKARSRTVSLSSANENRQSSWMVGARFPWRPAPTIWTRPKRSASARSASPPRPMVCLSPWAHNVMGSAFTCRTACLISPCVRRENSPSRR